MSCLRAPSAPADVNPDRRVRWRVGHAVQLAHRSRVSFRRARAGATRKWPGTSSNVFVSSCGAEDRSRALMRGRRSRVTARPLVEDPGRSRAAGDDSVARVERTPGRLGSYGIWFSLADSTRCSKPRRRAKELGSPRASDSHAEPVDRAREVCAPSGIPRSALAARAPRRRRRNAGFFGARAFYPPIRVNRSSYCLRRRGSPQDRRL